MAAFFFFFISLDARNACSTPVVTNLQRPQDTYNEVMSVFIRDATLDFCLIGGEKMKGEKVVLP
jgi:hypothetical protein